VRLTGDTRVRRALKVWARLSRTFKLGSYPAIGIHTRLHFIHKQRPVAAVDLTRPPAEVSTACRLDYIITTHTIMHFVGLLDRVSAGGAYEGQSLCRGPLAPRVIRLCSGLKRTQRIRVAHKDQMLP
jgi:hypothetical protein